MMLKSMTGYGRSVVDANGYTITVEMKSVNHRFKEVIFRMSKDLFMYEEQFKKIINERIKRGRIEVYITLEKEDIVEQTIELNTAIINGYLDAVKTIKDNFPEITGTIQVQELLLIPDVISIKKDVPDVEEIFESLEKAIVIALDELIKFRENEGKQLAIDCQNRLDYIDKLCKKIMELAPNLTVEYRNKLAKRIADILPDGIDIDESRLLIEVAIYADKVNVDEEITRIYSHLKQFENIISNNDEESIGRKLDFLVQELNREVNTIGSKSNNIDISSNVVELKSELEKIREQIQNIE